MLLLALAQSGENVREAPPQPPARAPEVTRAPSLVEFHPADYPPERLARAEEADVGCLVDIDADGRVTAVVVDRPAASDFDAAAVAAIRAFRRTSPCTCVAPRSATTRRWWKGRAPRTRRPAARSVTRSWSTCRGRSTTPFASCRTFRA